MSQREELRDPLLEELSNLEVFRRLVRCTPARGKLLRIVAALMSSNKALPRRLSEAYVGRFAVTQTETEEEDTEQAVAAAVTPSTTAGQDVAERSNCSHESSAATCSTTTTTTGGAAAADVASCSSNNSDSNKKTTAALAASVIQEIPPTPSSPSLEPLTVHAVVHESMCDEDALATDLGLRLGSFLSEAGWMQESISVLVCLNERLKHMQRFRDDLITRLDCLQRYVPHTNLCHLVQFINYSLSPCSLLFAVSSHCNFKLAQKIYGELMELNREITEEVPSSLIAMTYTQISSMYYARNEYNNSHMWSVQAMRHLTVATPTR